MKVYNENKELCSKCGLCCKKSGCDYFVSDFDSITLDKLRDFLSSGQVSIVSALDFKRGKNNNLMMSPFLYLRARNINRDIVDLISLKTTCSLLTENGCSLDKESRPGGGLNLIPAPDLGCHPMNNPVDMILKWEPYQKILTRLVKQITGKSINEKLKEDSYHLFLDILNENFEHVSKLELMDIKGLVYDLIEFYPEEYKKACRDYDNQKKKVK